MSLVNARAAFETAILDAVTDADPTVFGNIRQYATNYSREE